MSTKRNTPSPFVCPTCAAPLRRVLDSRPHQAHIERRRACSNGHRFTTRETITARNVATT